MDKTAVWALSCKYSRLASSRSVIQMEDPEGRSIGHLLWMLQQIEKNVFVWPIDKTMRWLGYSQCLMVVHGFRTLTELRSDCR